MAKGTVAIEEAVMNPASADFFKRMIGYLEPGADPAARIEVHKQRLGDIHGARLEAMDREGVEYMLLSLTSPGCQGEHEKGMAEKMARENNDWLAAEVQKNPSRFGALAALSMHDPVVAAAELRRAVHDLGMFGALLNDFQSVGPDGNGKEWYDTEKFWPFWGVAQELDVPIYLHPRWPPAAELEEGTAYGDRRHLLGAAVSFHLDLSWHIYALCASGLFDKFPKVQIVIGHLGENIPLNLWRSCHWYNKPFKREGRPSKEDYKYYFTHNISITTSGNFNTRGLKYCIEEIGIERCLYSIDTPYDNVKDGQDWWKTVDLPEKEKEMVARGNAIRLFKLPLEP